MPLYKYKFFKDGKEIEETKEFKDKASLYLYVRENQGSVLKADEVKSEKNYFSFISFSRIKIEDQISFAKNLAVMIDAGLSVSRALSIFQKQSRNKKMLSVLNDVSSAINSGESLSKSLEKHSNTFSKLFVSLVKSGEESGKLSYSLRLIANQLEKTYALSRKVKGAMIYPAVIIVIMIVIALLMMVFMVPTLTATFEGLNVPLPLPTKILIWLSNFLIANIVWVLIFIVSFIGLAIVAARSKRGQVVIDFVALHFPVFGTMVKEVNSARTARTLASLISSGVDIISALTTTQNVLQNSYYKEVLAKAAQDVQSGELVSSVFIKAPKLYPVFVGEMTSVGEETGQLSSMLENIAEFYEAEVDQKTKNLSTIIEPFLMVIIGIAVGIFAFAMLAPTYSLVDVIGA